MTPGPALTSWSSTHGDLRVSHFFALGVGAHVLFAGGGWLQALASRPAW
jgi:hypothetical protein